MSQYQRYLIESGYYDITPEQEEEIYEANEMAWLEAHAREPNYDDAIPMEPKP